MNPKDNMTLKATVERLGDMDSGDEDRPTRSLQEWFAWPGRIALLLAVVFAPWAVGSVENWAQRWIMAGLLLGLAFWWFETSMNKKKSQVFPFISLLVVAGIGIGFFQTFGLPSWAADSLVGRQQEIYSNFSGDTAGQVSISLDREGTWSQIRLLVMALAGLLLGCRYFRSKRDIVLLMTVVTVNGSLMAFLGIVNKLTYNGKVMWIRELTMGGSPFGPFVNRNNGAGYLLMCLACAIGLIPIVMANRKNQGPRSIISKEIPLWRQLYFHLLEFVSELTATKLAVLISVILISSGIITTLSRGGVVALLMGAIATVLLYGMARKPKKSTFVLVPLAGFVLVLSGWIGFGDELLNRFEKIDMVEVVDADARVKHWQDTWQAVGDMGFFGSGLGSYHNVHRLYRTDKENVIFEYAENQYFQSIVESGWSGFALFMLAWLLAFQYASTTLFRGSSPTTIGVGTMAMFAIFSQATASFFDYGLYIPANMLLFAVLMGFLACHAQSLGGRLKTGVWFQAKTPNYLVQVFVLGLFAVSTMVALDFHRRATLDSLMRPRSQFFDRENMDLTKTDTRIRDLTALVKQTPTTDSLNYLGALWLHRSQLAHYESFTTNLDSKILMDARTDEEKRKKLDNYWSMTEILRMQEKAFYLKKFGRRGESQAYIFGKPVADNLPWALGYYEISRRASPLQPLVHLRIGEIKSVLRAEHPREADVDVERAIELAPMNPNFRNIAGIYYLQSGNGLAAVPHFRRYLEMVPNKFNSLMNLVTGRTSRRLEILSDEAMGEIIPKDGKMLYLFVTQHLASDSPMREKLLKEAMAAVVGSEPRMRGHYALVGDILKEQGGLENLKKAVEEYSLALRGIPNDPPTRYKRAELLYGLGRFEEALEDAENLEFHAPKNSTYRTLLKKVNSAVTDKKAGLE